MSKIAKNMLPYWKSVIIILALLVVQAMCDLALPSYTSDIIDVGIQNSGVEHVVPEKITEEELQTAQFIMTDDEADVWKNLYKEKDGYYELKDLSEDKLNQADEELTVPLIMNYQMSAMEVDTFKKSIAAQMGMDEAQLADMSVEQIGQMMHVELESFMQEKEDDDGNTKTVECVDVRSVFSAMLQSGTMTKDQLLSMRDDMEDTIDAMGSSLVKSMGVATAGPVYFRNQPVGCTATIIYQMYQEHGVEITPQYAGILCSAIISDTLMFRSPTCTAIDISTAEHLAQIADVNMEELSAAMFKAGSNLEGKTPKELFYRDFKQFRAGDMQFGVGQINSMDAEEIKKMKEMLKDYLQKALRDNRVDMIFFMLTNIMAESSEILCCGQNAKQIVIEAFDLPEDSEEIILKKVVSRKKQVVPLLMSTLQH